MTRRANGEGSIRHNTARCRWEARVTASDGRRVMVTAPTKTEVSAKLAALRTAVATGTAIADGSARFGEVAAGWRVRVLEPRLAERAPSTRDRALWIYDLAVAELGRRRLRALTAEQVEAALDRIAAGAHGRPLARSTLTRVRAMVIEIGDHAVRRRMVASNVARVATLSPSAAPQRRQRSLTPAETRRLWDALGDGDGDEPKRLGPMFRLMLATGLRPGEAAALCWDSVDLDGAVPTLTVRRGVRLESGRPVLVSELKTTASFRTIALGAAAAEVLLGQRRRAAGEVARIGEPRLVFTSAAGTVLDPANVRRQLARICRRVGIEPISPNLLRHTSASLMSDAGQPLELIADLLGHTSTNMLDATYRHRLRSAHGAALVLDAVLGAEGGPG